MIEVEEIKTAANRKDSLDLRRLRRIAGYASVTLAVSLVLLKIAAYFLTGSVALLSSLVDSGVDVLASLMTILGIVSAAQPPDRDHRFGHGKAESLSALAQAAFIVGSSLFILIEAAGRFASPVPLVHAGAGFAVMVFSIFATFALLFFQTYVVRKTGSLAVSADRMHYAGDALINLAVMFSMALQSFWGQNWADPVFAIFIAAFLLRGAARVGKKALAILMDAELPEADRAAILRLALSARGVRGAHDLRTRSDSERPIVEIHVEMDGQMTLSAAHDVVEAVEARIRTAYPKADILIHQDPAGVVEDRLDARIETNDPLV